jgi:hypothetical protein
MACELPSDEDRLLDFTSQAPATDIDEILRPNLGDLQTLLDAPHEADPSHIPVLDYLNNSGLHLDSTVPYCGDLTINDRAGISHWFWDNVDGARARTTEWLGRAALAHSFTLVIAARKREQLVNSDSFEALDLRSQRTLLLQAAWRHQYTEANRESRIVDVDRECLAAFERRLFECSAVAGPAGNWQWGLDVGHLEQGWCPYNLTPDDWNDGTYEGNEEELQVCVIVLTL